METWLNFAMRAADRFRMDSSNIDIETSRRSVAACGPRAHKPGTYTPGDSQLCPNILTKYRLLRLLLKQLRLFSVQRWNLFPSILVQTTLQTSYLFNARYCSKDSLFSKLKAKPPQAAWSECWFKDWNGALSCKRYLRHSPPPAAGRCGSPFGSMRLYHLCVIMCQRKHSCWLFSFTLFDFNNILLHKIRDKMNIFLPCNTPFY